MRKCFLLFMGLILSWSAAMAVPAKPGIHTVTQPDGSTLQVVLSGDEWHHSFVTPDGYTIKRADDGFFYYVTTVGITKIRVNDAENRTEQENLFLKENNAQMTMQALYAAKFNSGKLRNKTKGVALKAASEVPTSGSPKIPVLLVQYSDISMKHTLANFQSHYNTQTWSVLQYFTDQSKGAFTPQFDIYGIYTLNNNRQYYGGNNSSGDDQRVGRMVSDAISKAGNNIDWSQYDNDGDGYVDACIVVYAGPGEASGASSNTIWPCQWYLSASDYGNYVTRNNTKIDKFAVFCELNGNSDSGTTLDGVGTFCHEFSHCLGLPDFYPTDQSNHFGMGDWSLLHGGCYNNNGDRPCGYTAYERNFMGWITLTTPVEGTTYTTATVDAGGQAFKITSNNSNEYYIIENIQKTGWNQYAPASGLLVNHVNYSATTWNNNTVNNSNNQGMTIIPADNSLKVNYYSGYGYEYDSSDEVGDLYPYGGNNQLTSTSTPAATLYNSSTNLNKPITNITKNSNNTVSFTYMGAPEQQEETGGTASDAYLNVAKYETIGVAGTQTTGGWNANYVNNLYKYTEDQTNKCAWLTMPVYGAWASVYYAPKAQKWITTNYNQSPGTSAMGSETWTASSPLLGSGSYFTSATAKYFGNTSTTASAARTISFNVKNVTEIRLLGKNAGGNSNVGNNRRCTVNVYKCTLNGTTITPETTAFKTATGANDATGAVNLSITGLDENEIYRVVVSTTRTHVYEIGFKTPLKTLPGVPIEVEADPGSTTADITWTPGSDNTDWNLRYREYVEGGAGGGESTLWDLNNATFDTWVGDFSIYDADGDGDNWGFVYTDDAQTDLCFASFSYDSDTQTDLTPDNRLYTREVQLGGTLKFKAAVASTSWPDKLGVYVAPTGDEYVYKLGDVVPEVAFSSFGEYEFDLSEYAGLTGQIMFRHYESDGNYAILLDDIEIIPAGTPEGPWIYVYSEDSPYTITGLTPETTYEVQVQGVNGDGVSDWTASTIFTTLADVDTPVIVSAEPTATTSEVTWTAGANNDDWNLRYREYVETTMESKTWTFPVGNDGTSVVTDGWGSSIDFDGDGYDWGLMATDGDETTNPTDACWYSESYVNEVGAVNPDNWLISPEITFGGQISFYAWGVDASWAAEVFNVLVAPSSAIEGTTVYTDQFVSITPDVTVNGTKTQYTFDLSAYQGTGYVVIQHHNVTDQFCLAIDDITVTYPSGETQPEWIYVYSEESPYTIEGLTPETTYEVQVQGVNDISTSAWTASTLFTTLAVEGQDLAYIEEHGVPGTTYRVSNELVAVDYAIVGDVVYLWCKDQGNASIAPAPAVGDKIDYLRNDQYAQAGRAWDESNWVVLKFTPGSVAEKVKSITDAVGHELNAGTITGVYSDAVNYTITMPAGEGMPAGAVGDESSYTPNVYCVANFNPANLTADGAQSNENGNVYFFMTPKVQEVCEITYAYWNAENFIVPTTSGFVGSLSLNWAYNEAGDVTDDLNADNVYRFKTVVQRTGITMTPALKAEGGNYKVAPLNLTSDSKADIPTAIGTVKAGVDVVDVYFVNSIGVMSKTPFHGVNVVVTRYSDGSRSSVKKVFK